MADDGVLVGGGGKDYAEPRDLLLHYANRHGLITGATGTGKTVTLQILAEGLSAAGVPVFIQDAKGDVSGLSRPGRSRRPRPTRRSVKRAAQIGMTDFAYRAYPVVFWDLFGQSGHPVRTTVTEMGPLLLARMMELSEPQEGVLNIAFRVADEQGLALLDLKDLQAMLVWLGDNAAAVGQDLRQHRARLARRDPARAPRAREPGRGRLSRRAGARSQGPHRHRRDGMGRINVLMSDKLMQSPRLYAMFLLWLLSELFEQLPEVGDPDKPVLVFFFDEAHLLFNDAPKALVDKVAQVVRLVRSKGVGVYLCTQNPDDVPSDVLAQLGNRVQHALRAFTPRDAKALKQAAETFRPNPDFDTETAIREVGTGEAVVSLLEAKGVPAMVSRTLIRPPESRMGPITEAERAETIAASPLKGKYDTAVDREFGAGDPRRPRRQGRQGSGDGRRDAEAGPGAGSRSEAGPPLRADDPRPVSRPRPALHRHRARPRRRQAAQLPPGPGAGPRHPRQPVQGTVIRQRARNRPPARVPNTTRRSTPNAPPSKAPRRRIRENIHMDSRWIPDAFQIAQPPIKAGIYRLTPACASGAASAGCSPAPAPRTGSRGS